MPSSFDWRAAAALVGTAAISSAITLYLVRRKGLQASSDLNADSLKKEIASGDSKRGSANNESTAMDSPELENRVLRKAETVIQGRTSRVIVVVERCVDDHNYSAIIRTAEALGVQHIWLIDPVVENAELQLEPPEKVPVHELQATTPDSENTERSSKFGVVWHKLEQKWRALLTIGAKTTNLGFFDTEDAAARAYDNAAASHGLPLNFASPKSGDEDGDGAADGASPLGYTAPHRYEHNMFAKRATEWVTLREFATTAECVEALRLDNRMIWATDLSQHAVCLTQEALEAADNQEAAATAASGQSHGRDAPKGTAPRDVVPERLAVVFGTESVGCTAEILAAADRRVYLPLRGFADSLNLSVSAALVLQQLFHLSPGVVASMPEAERHELRAQWFPKVGAIEYRVTFPHFLTLRRETHLFCVHSLPVSRAADRRQALQPRACQVIAAAPRSSASQRQGRTPRRVQLDPRTTRQTGAGARVAAAASHPACETLR